MAAVDGWIKGDESAKEMLARVLTERPFLLLPPLHRLPLRFGNVVEIVGPSPSAKSEILIQAAINCVLPKEWNGVHFGGLERLVMYFDLDCCFDVLRLSQSLKHRIIEAHEPRNNVCLVPHESPRDYDAMMARTNHFDEELFGACMRRFLYIRCYRSCEFLAALKTTRYRLQKENEAHGTSVGFLMIDSINAFYWGDRASNPLPLEGDNRKIPSLQSITESVVQEIRKLLQVQSMLVLATKATILGMGAITNEVKRTSTKFSSSDNSDLRTSRRPEKHFYHEYMPSVWQLFVTHRIVLQVSDENFVDGKDRSFPIYLSQWVLPPLNFLDKFTVRDAGIFLVM
ncbi:homolog of X-ray repair cross complementing 2 (XRCC2) [Tasmannia lanceolata]|uniref:homolog of X-ray repair cross complementing 2 (XRCC2) n=1 Tax=Tasmannia lanceolata TaxID=3420 RepID=UPI004062B1CD